MFFKMYYDQQEIDKFRKLELLAAKSKEYKRIVQNRLNSRENLLKKSSSIP